jgi:hypothetical protein
MNAVGWESSVWTTPEIDREFTGWVSEDKTVGFLEFVVSELTVAVGFTGCESSGKRTRSSQS